MSYAGYNYKQQTKGDVIERRVQKTCQQVKHRDIFLTLTILVTCVVAYFFLFVLLDHWIFKGGVAPVWRQVFFFAGLTAAGIYAVYRFLPLLRYSINPLYAAKILEGHRPAMKNTLINWIFLRRDQTRSSQRVLESRMIEGVAAKTVRDLDEIPAEMVVDHTPVIRWGIALIVLAVLLAFYTLFSPKNPFGSFARLAMPFSNISAQTRVRFLEITPGNATVMQGETATVTARIEGGRKNQPVYLYYSTSDGRLINQVVPMEKPEGDFRYECRFPPGRNGFEQGITYQIAVGDERSSVYRLTVQSPQIFEVQSLTYKYPAYTGVSAQTVQGTGDIRAVEGTQVVITAKANFPLKTAAFVPNGDEQEAKPLVIDSQDDKTAAFSFYLNSLAGDPNRPEFQSYVLRWYDSDRNTNRNPSVHKIEMLKDKPPKISWVDPPKEMLKIPQNGFTEVRVSAEDADFGLRSIRIHFDVDGKTLTPLELLPNTPATGPTKHNGIVNAGAMIKPDALRLEVGDEVEFWAEAVDTLLPKGNTAVTDRLSFVVERPKPGADQKDANEEKQEQQQEQRQEQKEEGNDSDNQTQETEGDKQAGEDQGNDGDRPDEPGQPNQEDHQNQNNQQQGGDNSQDQQGSQDGQQGNTDGNQPGEQEKGDQGDPSGQQQGDSGQSNGTEPGNESETGGEMEGQNPGGDPNDQSQGGTGEGVPDTGETSGNETPGGQNGGQDGQAKNQEGPLDPDSQPGDVFDKVLERMKEQGIETDPDKAAPSDGPRTHSDELDPNSDQLSDKGTAPDQMPTEKIQGDEDTPTQQAYKTTDDDPNANKEQADPNRPVMDDPTQQNAMQSSDETNPSNESGTEQGDGEQQPQDGGEGQPGQPQEGGEGQLGNNASNDPSGQQGNQSGGTGNTSLDSLGANPEPPVMNDPNLDFAARQTSLALKYLEEEMGKQQPDPELLRQLGWSKEDLQAFVEKWKTMSGEAQKAAPGSSEDAAWKELLRSLGTFKPDRATSVGARTTNEDRATATGSPRFNAPANLRQRAEAYNEGVSRQ